MRAIHLLTGLLGVGLLAAVGLLIAEDQTAPSPYYLQDDVQYFPAGPASPVASQRQPAAGRDAALGELLFADVVSVYFVGPALQANSDGSLGGLAADDDGYQIKIFEHYIVREATDAEGQLHRTLYAYEQLGKIEQRLARPKG